MKNIKFQILSSSKAYDDEEKILIKEDDDKVMVTITKMLPSPGYKATASRICKERGRYRIYLDIVAPDTNSMQLQVMTYKTQTLEIKKSRRFTPPYNFVVELC